jgi:hypothetical protein
MHRRGSIKMPPSRILKLYANFIVSRKCKIPKREPQSPGFITRMRSKLLVNYFLPRARGRQFTRIINSLPALPGERKLLITVMAYRIFRVSPSR